LSASFFQSCVLQSDGPEDPGGSTSGGIDAAGNSAGGATSGIGGASVGGSISGAGGSFAGVAGSISGAGGSFAGVAGSISGASGSFAGLGGPVGGAGGSFAGIAGSISGAGGSFAGIAGSNVAGSDASGGGAGTENGGLGGASAGGAAGGATAGACSGADPSCAGMTGTAGLSGSGGSGGSNGDPSLPLVLSTNLINFPATECGTVPTSKTFTITNPSSVTKTWRAVAVGAAAFLAEPTGSSLAPGEVVTVTVTPPFVPLRSQPNGSNPLMTGGLAINDAGSYQTLMLSEPIAGAFYSWTPANLNFGVVPLNTSATLHLTQSGDSSGRAAGNNPAFVGTSSPASWHEWTFTFNATSVGTQTATFTWVSVPYNRAPCTPDTFTATAVVPAPVQ
jgi:hypothetical protein